MGSIEADVVSKTVKVKNFLEDANDNANMANNVSDTMRVDISSYLIEQIKALAHNRNIEVVLPEWSNQTLIRHAYALTEYEGLLTIANRPENRDNFANNYLSFSKDYEIENVVENGNIFIQYIHVVKLFRQIHDLNTRITDLACEASLNEIRQCYEATESIIRCLAKSKNEENSFWILTLVSLAAHALASVHYIYENDDFYDLEKSRELLSMVEDICREGQVCLDKTDPKIIAFYTICGSLISTLPYKSFEEQRDDISSLPIWNLTCRM